MELVLNNVSISNGFDCDDNYLEKLIQLVDCKFCLWFDGIVSVLRK